MTGGRVADLFVYGTLVPGERAWDVVARFVVGHRPASVAGRLYDTGRGYPAATFGGGGVVRGAVLRLDAAEEALAHLDAFEGDEYDRVHVRTNDGALVVAYEWNGQTTTLCAITSGTWGEPPKFHG